MRSLGQPSLLRQRNLRLRVIMFAAMLAFIIAAIPQSSVSAAGAIGSGGGASGGSGGAQTTNGWGWYNYPASGGEKPYGFRDGDNWPRVSNLCRSFGADRVISFIVLRVKGTDANTGVVYNYLTSWDNFSNYRGNSGGNWLRTSTAKSLYDSINVDKTGFTWGVNVAWFCYDSNPPPVEYSLNPSITNNTSGVVEPESVITVNPRVNNAGPAQSANTQWRLTYFQVASGNNIPRLDQASSSYNTSSEPCSFYVGAGVTNCRPASFASGGAASGSTTFAVGTLNFTARTAVIGDLSAGTKVCYALSVQPRAHNSGQWRHSNPTCMTLGKRPKVQILGGDLWVGVPFTSSAPDANVNTSSVVKANVTFGSWVEYGIFATGVITGTGSGSAYAGSGLVDATVCKANQLSFTNAADSTGCKDNGSIGDYATSRFIPDVGASFLPVSTTPTIGANDIADQTKSGVFTASGSLTLNAGTLQKGRWLVINAPEADITISGNITYTTDLLQSIYDIPQLVIIAKNIIIADSVTQIDAWLIAKGSASSTDGTINTCASVGIDSPLTTEICNQKLTVNGPVMANKLYLRRTFGSNPCIGSDCSPSSDPAEVFNLRPDAYLWASARSVVSGRLQTVYTTELPPRL